MSQENQTQQPDSVMCASLFTDYDVNLFKQGTHYQLYSKLGSHPMMFEGMEGVYFAVWAPNAKSVSVIGDFNGWNKDSHHLKARWDSSGRRCRCGRWVTCPATGRRAVEARRTGSA